MTAQEQMRAMLDQLMGTQRNGEDEQVDIRFQDSYVCKSFLLNCCPHEILASTRADLGTCRKVHDFALRADYEKAAQQRDYEYEVETMEHLSNFIADCDKKTEYSKKKLEETQEELSLEVAAKANRVHELGIEIGKKLAKAEQLGAEGNVEESMKLMEEVDEVRGQKLIAENEYRNAMPASTYQQQKLRVCEVCCAYLGIHDNDRRLADHFGGKLHLGFIEIREKLENLKKTVEEKKKKREEDPDYRPPSEREAGSRDYDRNRYRNDGHYRNDRYRYGTDRYRGSGGYDTRYNRDDRRHDDRRHYDRRRRSRSGDRSKRSKSGERDRGHRSHDERRSDSRSHDGRRSDSRSHDERRSDNRSHHSKSKDRSRSPKTRE